MLNLQSLYTNQKNITKLNAKEAYADLVESFVASYKQNLNEMLAVAIDGEEYETAELILNAMSDQYEDEETLYNLTIVKLKLQKYREAILLGNKYIDQHGPNYIIFDVLGDSHCYLEQYQEAKQFYEKVLSIEPYESVQEKLTYVLQKCDSDFIKGDAEKEKERLETWANEFYTISKYGKENRKKYNVNHVFLFKEQMLEIKLTEFLIKYNFPYLYHCKILDVGCGEGRILRKLLDWGANPENLYGVDIHPDTIALAKDLSSPHIRFSVEHADDMSFPEEQFDIVLMVGVLQHILDPELARKIGKEVGRVLKKDGLIITYNINHKGMETGFKSNTLSKTTKGIEKKELEEMFPEFEVRYENFLLTESVIMRQIEQGIGVLLEAALDRNNHRHEYGIATLRRKI